MSFIDVLGFCTRYLNTYELLRLEQVSRQINNLIVYDFIWLEKCKLNYMPSRRYNVQTSRRLAIGYNILKLFEILEYR